MSEPEGKRILREWYANRDRCGWCGAYEGTVDPNETCTEAKDPHTGEPYGPHQFAPTERQPQEGGNDG